MTDEMEIAKETFVAADERTKWAITFDLLQGIRRDISAQLGSCEKRFCALEQAKARRTLASTIAGFFGGAATVAGSWLMRKP